MTTFRTHTNYIVDSEGRVERRDGQLPAVIHLPPISVSVPEAADPKVTATLLRRLVDEIEGTTP